MASKIIQWNCRGVIKRYCDIGLLLQNDPICLCLQETKFSPDQVYSRRGYNIVRYDVSDAQRACGGVAIFLKDNIPYREIAIQSVNLQVVAVEILLPKKLTVCNLYLPNQNWQTDDLDKIIAQLPKPFVVTGDFNAHSPLWGSTKRDTKGISLENWLDRDDIVLLNDGSHTSFNTISNCFDAIDLSFSSSALASSLKWTVVQDLHNSDHFPILIEVECQEPAKSIPRRWILERANWQDFRNKLVKPSINDPKSITECIITAAETSIPKSSGRPLRRIVPWWNAEVENSIKNKKTSLNRFKKSPTIDNLIAFKKARAKARKIVLESKRNSWNNFTSTISSNTNINEIWRKVKAISGNSISHPPYCIVTETGVNSTDPFVISETIANQFQATSSSTNYSPSFLEIKPAREINLNFHTNEDLPYNSLFSIQELEFALSEAKACAPGSDFVVNDMLKNLTSEIKIVLLHSLNQLWNECTYPIEWKEAIVIPLLKANRNPLLPTSFRPISLTSCMGKLFERMINNRLMWFLEKENILVPYQSGFRKGRSTMDHLVALENSIQESFRRREHCVAVFFDIKGAYDTTWRYGVLHKLYKYGLRGKLPLLIKSFLSERNFRVRIGNTLSEIHTLENGTPQGSTLSCTLFALAINEIAENIDSSISRYLYVDDLSIVLSGKTVGEITRKLQPAINSIIKNGEDIGFVFAKEKMHCIHFCKLRRPHYDPMLFAGDVVIKCVNSVKFLGLVFDRTLTWIEHINTLVDKCRKFLNVIKMLAHSKWGADPECLIRIYNAIVLSRLDYGCAVYSSARKSLLRKLDIIHHAGIRYCIGAFPTSPIKKLYEESGIPSLTDRRHRLMISYISNILSQTNHPNHNFLFTPENTFSSRPTITRPLGVRFKEFLDSIEVLGLPNVFPEGVNEIPPWNVKEATVRLDLQYFNKTSTPRDLYLQNFLKIKDELSPVDIIYTDGSKTNNGVGCAFAVDGQIFKWTLHKMSSIFFAEQYAVWQSLLYILMNPSNKNFLIVSDSLSVLQSLKSLYTRDPMTQMIQSAISNLIEHSFRITFLWVPSHIGINGNELADSAARSSTIEHCLDVELIKRSDIKIFLQNKILNKSAYSKYNLPREDTTKAHRLRIGHTALTHQHLLRAEPAPRCPHCDVVLTVQHIICECPHYDAQRQQSLIKPEFQENLNNTAAIRNTLEFLRVIDIYKKL